MHEHKIESYADFGHRIRRWVRAHGVNQLSVPIPSKIVIGDNWVTFQRYARDGRGRVAMRDGMVQLESYDVPRVTDWPGSEQDGEDLRAALSTLRSVIVSSSRDWSLACEDAWLWALLVGWDCEESHEHDQDCPAPVLEDLAKRFGWRAEEIRCQRAAIRSAAGDMNEPEFLPASGDMLAFVETLRADRDHLKVQVELLEAKSWLDRRTRQVLDEVVVALGPLYNDDHHSWDAGILARKAAADLAGGTRTDYDSATVGALARLVLALTEDRNEKDRLSLRLRAMARKLAAYRAVAGNE